MGFHGVMAEDEVYQMNPLQLAYMGDTVWEMLIREKLIRKRLNVHHMHARCVSLVNAQAQSESARRIEPCLIPREKEVFLRGRNAHARHPSPRHQDPRDYAAATGLEAVFGYLYLSGQTARILELFDAAVEGEEDG